MNKASDRLAYLVNEVGNLLTAAKWPNITVNHSSGPKTYDSISIYKELAYAMCNVLNQNYDLNDCVNELCLQCGNSSEAHTGACDGCRWKALKETL